MMWKMASFYIILQLLINFTYGIYDTNTLINFSSALIKYYSPSCIKIIHDGGKSNETEYEKYQLFKIVKNLTEILTRKKQTRALSRVSIIINKKNRFGG